MLTLIPAADRIDFSQFPRKLQDEVVRVLPYLEAVRNAEGVVAGLQEQAAAAGMPVGTFRRKFYAYKAHGWRGVIPANKVRRFVRSDCSRITNVFVSEWKRRVENVQRRAMRQAWHQLMRDLRAGVEIPGLPHWAKMFAEDFPGAPIPEACPTSWIPHGLSYSNLKSYAPTAFELRTARQGRRAAASLRPLVAASRKDLECGQIIMFDDMWHDHKVNFLDRKQTAALRPLEFHAIDLFSTRKIAYGIRPRLLNDDGTHSQLKGREMRMLVCQILCTIGYRPAGTIFQVEHGTAAISADLEEYIDYATDGAVKVSRGGIDTRPLVRGAFTPKGCGNFRSKASLESLGGLYHNALALLPAQTGLSPAMQPESLHGLDKINSGIIKAMLSLSPERAAKLRFPVLEFNEFASLLMEIYERIDSRTDHALEGWAEAGNVEQVYLPGPGIDPIPMARIMAAPDKFAGVIALATSAPETFCDVRRLSPADVWHRGAANLARVSIIHAPAILGKDNALPTHLNSRHEAWTTDPETHARTRYSPECREFNNAFSRILPKGNYFFYPIPGDSRAVVCDENHTPLGWTVQMAVATRADRQSMLEAHGQAEHVRALMEAGYRERHAPEGEAVQAMVKHNNDVINFTLPEDAPDPDVEDSAAYTAAPACADQDLF
jgi:hypothetical protein